MDNMERQLRCLPVPYLGFDDSLSRVFIVTSFRTSCLVVLLPVAFAASFSLRNWCISQTATVIVAFVRHFVGKIMVYFCTES